jgi:tyrosinase
MRIRKDVSKLPADHPILVWYGRAVAAMRALPTSHPHSWEFQAAVHGVDPTPPDMTQWWSQCQHGSSFFLPWHRMYILRFERIVAKLIARLGGPADWALPYWDYSNPDNRRLPEAFRREHLPDGSPNPLYVEERNALANAGEVVLGPKDVDLRVCLTAEGDTSPTGFFGGPNAGHYGQAFGRLELTPHNAVHRQVGAGGGYMEDPDRAALDPIFWLHHANIDRLWEVWLRRDPTHANLSSTYWRYGVSFRFFDENEHPVTMRVTDVLDLTSPALAYAYEDTSDPLGPPHQPLLDRSEVPTMAASTLEELAGATMTPVLLDGRIAHVDVPTPVTPQAFRASQAATGLLADESASANVPQVTLLLEHVTSSATAPTFDIYIGVPANDDPAAYEDRFVARVAMFGIAQASSPTGPHGGSGQDFAFDITDIYRRLAEQSLLSPQNLRVSFVPVTPVGNPQVSVGRISLYFG